MRSKKTKVNNSEKIYSSDELNLAMEIEFHGGHRLNSTFKTYRIVSKSREFGKFYDVLEEDNESTTQFRMEDNSYREVSLDELKQLRSYIKRAGIVLTKLKWAKEEAIKNAKTFEELIACPHEISEEDISNVLFPPVEETAAPKKATKKKAKATEE